MSANPIEPNDTPKTTGTLEDLFRHHLAEAAVPPRPRLWNQLDNALLLRQNEQYRRRLATMRWVAAASLLLALLSGTGWWLRGDGGLSPAGGHLAQTAAPAARAGAAASTAPATSRPAAHLATTATGSRSQLPSQLADQRETTDYYGASAASDQSLGTAGGPAAHSTNGALALQQAPPAARRAIAAWPGAAAASGAALVPDAAGRGTGRGTGRILGITGRQAAAGSFLAKALNGRAAGRGASSARAASRQSAGDGVLNSGGVVSVSGLPLEGPAVAGIRSLSTRAIALQTPSGTLALPTALAEVPFEHPAARTDRAWQYGATYAVGVYNPDVNFSRAGIAPEFDYNPALGPNSPALSEAAAAEYRDHLRGGLSLRAGVQANRRLAGHWTLRTGLELTQSYASSATRQVFVGEQVPDLGQPPTSGELRTSTFRYRTAGLPVEVAYGNSIKRGWSLYGRVGAAVTALLGARTEVAGYPESTRSYSLASSGPYRKAQVNVRGAAGVQWRADKGPWGFTLGPVAEAGLLSLNAHPAQDYFSQSRPYSFGVEAGVTVGR